MGDINKILRGIMEDNPSILEDDRKLRTLLRNWYADDKLSANALFNVYDSGIVEHGNLIRKVSEDKLRNYVDTMESEYGMKPEIAKKYIGIWFKALDVEYTDYSIPQDKKEELSDVHANDEEQARAAVDNALGTLSFSERKAATAIMQEIKGMECQLVASKIADRFEITRSVIVGALKKLEAAGLIQSKSMGAKGMYIKILNQYLPEMAKEDSASGAVRKFRSRI